MRKTVSGLMLGGVIAATSVTMAGACQYHQTTAGNDQATPAIVAQTDAPAPAPVPIIQPNAAAEPAGQTHTN